MKKLTNCPKKKSTASFTTIASWTHKLSLSILILVCQHHSALAEISKVIIKDAKFDRKTEQVTTRIKVEDKNQNPIEDLQYNNFRLFVENKQINFRPQDFKNPKLSTPAPTRIIILLDKSGSMNHAVSEKQTKTKLQASIDAIRTMIEQAAAKGGDIQFSIVPFGKGGGDCEKYTADEETLKQFLPAGSPDLQTKLSVQAKQTSCSTNLYEPLLNAIRFLSDTQNSDLYPAKNSGQSQRRLSIILLTDGYHNQGKDEEYQKELKDFLTNAPDLTVYTLGYGLTPEELQEKYAKECGFTQPVTRANLSNNKCSPSSQKKLAGEFVDQEALFAIGKWGHGGYKFSGDPQAIAKDFLETLNSILGEYEITYNDPNPQKGATHEVYAAVNQVSSESPKTYLVDVYGRTPPMLYRYLSFFGTIGLLLIGGGIPFYFWGEGIKKDQS